MDAKLQAFLDATLQTIAHAESYIPGEAGEVAAYITSKYGTLSAAQTTKATVQDFINDAEALATTGAAAFGSAQVQTLVDEVVKTAQDGENGKVGAVIGDLLAIYKDAKALKGA
jgi:hypothetical protein